ncbi:hypothetical protein Tsubulata_016351 [Turnera subulata]|uniref:CCHC-type domain-containing protein n=1 Tax=Turnera subulata TaxID=218843 RepID=A0A9Q0F6A6_9ROSI|nr:hypothetical protein Tsubulata_016351 [Turnera subulata]
MFLVSPALSFEIIDSELEGAYSGMRWVGRFSLLLITCILDFRGCTMSNLELVLKPTDFGGSLTGGLLELARVTRCCLLGHIVLEKVFGLSYLKSTLQKLWKCRGNFEIANKGANIFLFQFQKEEDKSLVIVGAPWFCSNCHVVVKDWPVHSAWEQVDLGLSCIWVQVHGLPPELMNEDNTQIIGNSFGGLLESDLALKKILSPQSSIGLKVALWVDKPLLSGFHTSGDTTLKTWIRFKYKGLPECCWFCGRLGHSITRCPYKGPNDKPPVLDIPERGFGPWLRVESPVEFALEAPISVTVTEKRKKDSSGLNKKKPEGPTVISSNEIQTKGVCKENGAQSGVPTVNVIREDSPEYEPPINYSPASRIARGIGLLDSDVESPTGGYVSPPGLDPVEINEKVLAQERLEELERSIEARPIPVLDPPSARKWKRSARLRGP